MAFAHVQIHAGHPTRHIVLYRIDNGRVQHAWGPVTLIPRSGDVVEYYEANHEFHMARVMEVIWRVPRYTEDGIMEQTIQIECYSLAPNFTYSVSSSSRTPGQGTS